MKLLPRLFLIFTISILAYYNLPLISHTLIDVKVIPDVKKINFTFIKSNGDSVSHWEQNNMHLHWYNEEGYNGNGPDLDVSEIIDIKQIIIKSATCKTLIIDVLFVKKYSPQNYTRYFHHGSRAHMQYSFIKSVSLDCDKNV